jgi:hypothetical protein
MGTRVNCRDGFREGSFEWQPISKTLTRARKMFGHLCLRQEVSPINLINLHLLLDGLVDGEALLVDPAPPAPNRRGQIPTILLNPIVTASHNVPTFVGDKSEVGFGDRSDGIVTPTFIPDCVGRLRPN